MSLAFQRALAITLDMEGGYSNIPGDAGGPTKWGITQGTYDGWRHSHGCDMQPVALMDRPEMEAIYESDYWIPSHAGDMPMNLACAHFDAFVNHRPAVAFRLLQIAVRCTVDGKYGPETEESMRRSLATYGEQDVVRDYLRARRQFYFSLVMKDPTQDKFLRGWNNRIGKLARAFGVVETAVFA